jgi:hypothetical protein
LWCYESRAYKGGLGDLYPATTNRGGREYTHDPPISPCDRFRPGIPRTLRRSTFRVVCTARIALCSNSSISFFSHLAMIYRRVVPMDRNSVSSPVYSAGRFR